MNIQEIKNSCNNFYDKAIIALEEDEDINVIRKNILECAALLVKIGSVSIYEKTSCDNKAKKLLDVAKSLRENKNLDSAYFSLVGKQRVKKEDLLDDFDDFVKNAPSYSKIAETVDNCEVKTIRPQTLENYMGQDKVKLQLIEAIAAAKQRGEPLEHVLLFGSAGLGKTTLSKIIANKMGSNIIIMSGPTIKDVASFVQVIKNVKYGDIVFIDEIHRIPTTAAEAIYTVLEDFELSYIESKDKTNAENVTIHLPKFTMIGATTHSGLLEKPMRERFGLQFKLEPYNIETMQKIVQNSAVNLGLKLTDDGALEVAKRSRGVPRIANSYLKRIRDKAQVAKLQMATADLVKDFFKQNDIDDNGLTSGDIAYLKTLKDKFNDKPAGLDSISNSIGEGKNIIENQYEPYLIFLGLIQITSSGRILTESGKNCFNDQGEE